MSRRLRPPALWTHPSGQVTAGWTQWQGIGFFGGLTFLQVHGLFVHELLPASVRRVSFWNP